MHPEPAFLQAMGLRARRYNTNVEVPFGADTLILCGVATNVCVWRPLRAKRTCATSTS